MRPDTFLPLGPADLQVWRIPLQVDGELPDLAWRVLSPEECGRADRLRFPGGRERFMAAHTAFRFILSGYVEAPPGELEFAAGPKGKPSLSGRWASSGIRFNCSHSGDMALCAVARERDVGVDVERIRPGFHCENIARRFFSTEESEALLALPEPVRREAFFVCWTRKEAFIKALGEGLALPLNQFDVSFSPDAPPALLATRPDPQEAKRWSLFAIPLGPEYVGAVIAHGQNLVLTVLDWTWDPARRCGLPQLSKG